MPSLTVSISAEPRPGVSGRKHRSTHSPGSKLDAERQEIMLRRQLGLTKLYNLVNNPEIADSDDPDHELAESDRRNIVQTWLTFFNRE